MKTITMLILFFVVNTNDLFCLSERHSIIQTPSFVFVHTGNWSTKTAYITRVIDPDDFEGKNWAVKKAYILDASKSALNRREGNTAYLYSLGIVLEDKNHNGLLTNNYDASELRKKIIKNYASKGYNIIDLDLDN